MITGNTAQTIGASPMYAVPSNAGTRTMNYAALYDAGTYSLPNGIKVFAGTTDDAFWIDLGGTFDTLNTSIGTPVLNQTQDLIKQNFAADYVSGYNVNTIAIEVPISMITSDGSVPGQGSNAENATIGVWATTSRPRTTVRRSPNPALSAGNFLQVQRMGNPLINEVLIGTGHKDRFSMDQPANDSQFAPFFLQPTLPVVVNSLTGLAIPPTPRTDLLPVVQYHPPVSTPGAPGPVADLLRLNLSVPPTDPSTASRLGLLGGDPAGFPNGRRVFDDVTDIALRLVVGGVLTNQAPFNQFPYTNLGDGVNVNDVPYLDRFPYVGYAHAGNARRHIDPGEDNCTMNSGGPCAAAKP
jgi:hypothetical protein